MKIKTILTCAVALLFGGLRAQCFSLSDNAGGAICLGESVQLYATTDPTCSAMTYSWYPWGHIGSNYVITPTVTTVYTVIASNSATLTGTIVVNPLPVIGLTPSPPIIYCNSTLNTSNITCSGASTYTWIPTNYFIWAGNFNVTPIVTTVYTVVGTDGNGCSNSGTVMVKYDNSACPCIGCGGTVASTLNAGAFSGPFCINDDLLITGPVNFTNADLTIGTGVKITIAAGGQLNLASSHLYACNNMWQGIEIKNGGILDVKDCLIEDAIEAVDVTNHITQTTIFSILNTTFNKNNVAINIENYTEQIPIYPFTIQNCLFTCRDIQFMPLSFPPVSAIAAPAVNPETPLSNPYIDNSTYAQSGTNAVLKLPYSGFKPEAGIRLVNVGITLNPNSASTMYYQWEHGGPGNENYFDNLQNGMELYNANANVYNSVFQNSSVGIRCTASDQSHNSLQVISPAGTQNRFIDCNNGIYDRWYYNIAVTGADFRTTWGSTLNMVWQPTAVDVWTNRYRDCRIEDNTMYNFSTGIAIVPISNVPLFMPGIYNGGYWGQFAGNMLVNRNIIAHNVPTNPTTYQRLVTGINMQMYASQWYLYLADPSTQIVQVDKNNITSAEVGIYMSQWKWLNQSVNSNTVTLVAPPNFTATPTPNFGICLTICEGTSTQPEQVANNIIVGYGNVNPSCSGMLYGPGSYMDMTCNYVSNVTNGYNFNFMNSNISFRNNDMNTDQYGLVYNWGAVIGTQGSSSNPQDNTWTGLWGAGTYKTAVFGGADATNSRFYIRTSGAGPYNPNGSSISTTAPIINTEYSIANGNLIVSTSAPALAVCPIVPSSARMAPGEINMDELKSLAKFQPHKDPSIEFNRKTVLYQFAKNLNYQPNGNDTLSEIYSEIKSGIVGQFEKVEQAFAGGRMEEAAKLNESVSAGNKAEENTKTYYRTAIHYFNGSFSAADSINLNKLVEKCPFTEGFAIEKARVLYNMRYGPKVFANTCTEKDEQTFSSGTNRKTRPTSLHLYPNPSSGEVNVIAPGFGDAAVEISISDISGRCIYKKTHQLENGNTSFVLNCVNGAYLVTVTSAEEQSNFKLIIQK